MSHRSWPGTLQARGLWPGHRGPTLARGPGRCLADHTAQPRGPGRRDVEVTESQVHLGAAAGTRTQQLRPLSAWLTSPPGTCELQERNSGGGLSALGRVGASLALPPGGWCTHFTQRASPRAGADGQAPYIPTTDYHPAVRRTGCRHTLQCGRTSSTRCR